MRAARIPRLLALVVSGLLVLTACGPGDQDERSAGAPAASSTSDTQAPSDTATDAEHEGHELSATPSPSVKPKPLRAGERRVTLAMPEAYTPSAPNGVGTDDYRCFILDPQLDKDAYLTGTNVLPGNPAVVHHVIMFKLPPEAGAAAEQSDAADPGLGWTCFGNTGFGRAPGEQLDNAQWLGAWAPGGEEAVATAGFGTRLTKGTRIVMQVHYNLLAGTEPDISGMQLRLAPRSADLTELQTFLIPAPVELPCRPEHADGELCDRAAAVADVKARFGQGPGSTNDLLYFLCGERKKSGPVSSCLRTMGEPTTIRAVAGHPQRFFLRERLGVHIPYASEVLSDEEPVELTNQRALRQRLYHQDQLVVEGLRAEGLLPSGAWGSQLCSEQAGQVEQVRLRVQALQATPVEPVRVHEGVDGVTFAGVLEDLTSVGLVRVSLENKIYATDVLRLYFSHLLLCAIKPAGVELRSHLIGMNDQVVLEPVADPQQALANFAAAYQEGLCWPLPLFRRASPAWVKKQNLNEALKAWEGTDYNKGDREDAWIQLLWRNADPCDERFTQWAERLYGPLKDEVAKR